MYFLKQYLLALIFGIICKSIESHPTFGIPKNNTQVQILSREQWKAELPSQELPDLSLPVSKIIIAHTGTELCDSKEICEPLLRQMQKFDMDTSKLDDIAYNFVITDDGTIYEGRGWNKEGAHTENYNKDSIGIIIIGDFDKILPSKQELIAMENLMEYGVSLGKISKNYRLYGQNQLKSTASPGQSLYDLIKTYTNWSDQIN